MENSAVNHTITTWVIDPMQSEIQFKIKHLVFSKFKQIITTFYTYSM